MFIWLCPLQYFQKLVIFPCFKRLYSFFIYQLYSFRYLTFSTLHYEHGIFFYPKFHSYILAVFYYYHYYYCYYLTAFLQSSFQAFGTVPREAIIIGIIVIIMSPAFFLLSGEIQVISIFWFHSLSVQLKQQNLRDDKYVSSSYLTLGLIFWPYLDYLFISQNLNEIYASYSWEWIFDLSINHL